MVDSFSVQIEHEDRVCRLIPLGELDLATAPILERAFETAGATTAEKIVVDLTGLSFIDSTGLALLLLMADESEHDRLRIVNGPRVVQRVIELTGVADRLPIIDSTDDPLAALQRPAAK